MTMTVRDHAHATITVYNSMFNNDHFITIDTLRHTISVNGNNGIFPVMPLTFNKSHVLKINKTSISTCDIDMFTWLLSYDEDVFCKVYLHIDRYCSYAGENVTLSAFYNSFNDRISDWLEFFGSCGHETRQKIIADHFCYAHEAKMHGIISLSTYVGKNPYCVARCNNCDNAICKYCYANSLTNQRVNLKNKLIRIHAILTLCKLSESDIPVFDSSVYPYIRFESFGDINNVIQVNNYNLIAKINSGCNCTLWTKNPGIIQNAINNGMTISSNLVIGLSSLYLNKPEIEKAQKYSFIRFLFTVYDDEYIAAHDIKINCGAKHCMSCGICYKYLHEFKHGLQLINERKK